MYQTKNNFSGPSRNFVIFLVGLCIFITVYVFYIYFNPEETVSAITTGQLILVVSIALVTAVLLSFAAYWIHGFYTRCPHCRKKYAMKRQNELCVDRYQKKVGTSGDADKFITMGVYHLNRKCKYCGGEDYIELKREFKG